MPYVYMIAHDCTKVCPAAMGHKAKSLSICTSSHAPASAAVVDFAVRSQQLLVFAPAAVNDIDAAQFSNCS